MKNDGAAINHYDIKPARNWQRIIVTSTMRRDGIIDDNASFQPANDASVSLWKKASWYSGVMPFSIENTRRIIAGADK